MIQELLNNYQFFKENKKIISNPSYEEFIDIIEK